MKHWETVLAVDFDKAACEAHRLNFPDTPVMCAPVGDVLRSIPGNIGIIHGGPPCQPFSLAGEMEGEDDERDCIPDFIAAVDLRRPRHCLMENVRGLLSQRHFGYFTRTVNQFEALGYVVEWKLLDAVNFGVPQFRERVWVWGIRSDLYRDGMRHQWPAPTHAWPPPEPCMFGAALLPGVTVGQALGLDGWIRKPRSAKVIRRDHPTDEPCPTVESRAALGGGSCLKFIESGSKCRRDSDGNERGPLVKSIDNPSYTIDGTPPALRVFGGGRNHPADANGNYQRDITDEPSTTIPVAAGNALPGVHEYRWSDAMLAKHPLASPASPASPAPTVQTKWFKGGAEGLLLVDRPCPTISAGSHAGGPEPVNNRKRAGFVRRLTPLECARLQSMPDDYRWPEKVTKTNQYRIVGNGQASEFTRRLGDAIRAVDPECLTAVSLFCGGGLGDCGFEGKSWRYEAETAGVE